jgi:hypothetical protein
VPIQGPAHVLAAVRPAAVISKAAELTPAGTSVNTWHNLFTMAGAVVHDVDFPTARIGFAAAELGQVWKTTDGGKSWTRILNRGFPFYYYGVEALSRKTLVVSGFDRRGSIDEGFRAILVARCRGWFLHRERGCQTTLLRGRAVGELDAAHR